MRIARDLSLPPALREAGHDAVDLRDAGLRGAADEHILQRARDEQRALLTFDLGFASVLRYPTGAHTGILVGRMPDTMIAKARVSAIVLAIGALSGVNLSGALVIIEPGRVRIRRS